MKWFKHYTDASDDEFIVELEEIFGLEGYARWWKLLEYIAKQMDKTDKCSVAYPWKKWQTLLKGKRKKLETFLEHCENVRRISLVLNGNILEIKCPKLLIIRDNYSKNLQAADKKLASKEVDKEIDKEADKDLKAKEVCPAGSKNDPPEPTEIFIELPMIDGSYFIVETTYVNDRQKSFPAVDIKQQLRHMKAWLEDNPANRKTRNGIKSFITRWLSKEQNKASRIKKSNIKGVDGLRDFHQSTDDQGVSF